MKSTLPPDAITAALVRLREAARRHAPHHSGPLPGRQPVHTVYGGAHLYRRDLPKKLGALALRALDEHAPDAITFARAIGMKGHDTLPDTVAAAHKITEAFADDPDSLRDVYPAAWRACAVYTRVRLKLAREPVEDLRVDFEDGYGVRSDGEEDDHAVNAAKEMAAAMTEGALPAFVGIRIRSLSNETAHRAMRTLDLFVSTLTSEGPGWLPDNFVVTLPKVTMAEQVEALVSALASIEESLGLPRGAIKVELMVETPQALVSPRGELHLGRLVEAADGRCAAAHFGAYDYTAACDVASVSQSLAHPWCDHARHLMKLTLAATDVRLSDGATTTLPIGPHKARDAAPLSFEAQTENRRVVHGAWREAYTNIQRALTQGFYQGWDLHPAQLPVRYAAVYEFFLDGFESTAERLKGFIASAARATRAGAAFDDAATGQAMLNLAVRAVECRAVPESEVVARTGVSLELLRTRSFAKIVAAQESR